MIKKLFLILFLLFLILFGLRFIFLGSSPKKQEFFTPRFVAKKVIFEPPSLTLEAIFAQEQPKTATLSAKKTTTLITTGDVGLARSVNFSMVKRNDFSYPFEKTAEVLKKADLTLINLEGPLVKNCPLTNTGLVFCGNPRGIEGMLSARVNLVNLANNHTFDYGQKGLLETVKVLTTAGITPVEPEKIIIKKSKGQKFAFLGYGDVNQKVSEEKVQAQIREAESSANIVVVSFHWGAEYTACPNQRQRDLARLAIDSGADLIIGNHPHWIQAVEIYKEKLIVYSHGNFIFDQMWSKKTGEGIIGKYTFYEDKLIAAEFLPIFIDKTYQPHLLEEKEKEIILKSMEKTSRNLRSLTP